MILAKVQQITWIKFFQIPSVVTRRFNAVNASDALLLSDTCNAYVTMDRSYVSLMTVFRLFSKYWRALLEATWIFYRKIDWRIIESKKYQNTHVVYPNSSFLKVLDLLQDNCKVNKINDMTWNFKSPFFWMRSLSRTTSPTRKQSSSQDCSLLPERVRQFNVTHLMIEAIGRDTLRWVNTYIDRKPPRLHHRTKHTVLLIQLSHKPMHVRELMPLFQHLQGWKICNEVQHKHIKGNSWRSWKFNIINSKRLSNEKKKIHNVRKKKK